MLQKDKDLILRDICMRLPYNVMLRIESYDVQHNDKLIKRDIMLSSDNISYCFKNSQWVSFKPYLRSFDFENMTEEEIDEWSSIIIPTDLKLPSSKDFRAAVLVDELPIAINWLCSHHFDFNGLISKRLAIEAPQNIYSN